MWARLEMRSGRGHNNISFTCRENSSAATAVQGSNRRPANSRRREKDKRRREIWLERRKQSSTAGPPLSSQQPQPQQHLQVTSAAAESAAAVSSCPPSDTLSATAAATAAATSPPSILPSAKRSKTTANTAVRASERQSVIEKRKQPASVSQPTVSQPSISEPAISQLDGLSETPHSLTVSFPACSTMADVTSSPMHPLHTSSPTPPLAKTPAVDSAPAAKPASADAVTLHPTPPSLKAPPPPPPMSRYFPKEWWKVLCSECWRQSHGLQYHHCETCHRKVWG